MAVQDLILFLENVLGGLLQHIDMASSNDTTKADHASYPETVFLPPLKIITKYKQENDHSLTTNSAQYQN